MDFVLDTGRTGRIGKCMLTVPQRVSSIHGTWALWVEGLWFKEGPRACDWFEEGILWFCSQIEVNTIQCFLGSSPSVLHGVRIVAEE